MTIGMRGRRPLGMTAVVVVLLLVVLGALLGVLAWRAGGPQPIGEVVVPIAVPGAAG